MITPAQAECLKLKSKGLSIKEISIDLSISVRTVEYHLSEARLRLEAKDTTHAVVLALKNSFISFALSFIIINAVGLDSSTEVRRQPSFRVRVTRAIRKGEKEI